MDFRTIFHVVRVMLKEFKTFIARGNVVDLAVGVMVGGAFGSIITSVVNDLLMPLIGVIFGGVDFTSLVLKIGESEIKYGSLFQSIIDFFIVSFCVFLFVKIINTITKKQKKEEDKIQKEEVLLLQEIRDLLKEKNKS